MTGGGNNLAVRLLDQALERGWSERTALREGTQVWTYGQLADHVSRLAAALRTLRIQPGERIAILMRDSMDCATAILGTIYSGAVAVPISELSRPLDVRDSLNDCGAAAAIVHSSLEPALDEIRAETPTLREVLCTGAKSPGERDFHAAIRAAAPAPSGADVGPDDVALILYSSGGGQHGPVGIPHVHGTPMRAFAAYADGVLGIGENDRVFSVVRLSTAYGLGNGLLFPLAAGAETLLLPEQPRSEAMFAAIEKLDPTVLFATPSVYGQLARDAESGGRHLPLERIRVCVSGAEGMPPKLIPKIRDVLGTEVTVGYGLTEAFQFVLAGPADQRPGACGQPVQGVDVRIVNESGDIVGPDVIGNLQIRGDTMFRNYWGRDGDVGEWFTTQDRFLMDEEGNYYHCGRVDDLFKVGGKWVSPTELERALIAHEAVWECAVLGADDEDGLIKPLAFVVANIGHDAGPELEKQLRDYVKNELAPYKYPRWIEFVDHLPRGPNGKLLRYKLRMPQKLRPAETAESPG